MTVQLIIKVNNSNKGVCLLLSMIYKTDEKAALFFHRAGDYDDKHTF